METGMRVPLLALAAVLMIIATGTAVVNITVPDRPASILINASTLQPGQNVTLRLNYIPLNITVIKPSATWAALCMYFHGVLVDSYDFVWFDMYRQPYSPPPTTVTAAFKSAMDMRDSNVTIVLMVGQYDCPSSVR